MHFDVTWVLKVVNLLLESLWSAQKIIPSYDGEVTKQEYSEWLAPFSEPWFDNTLTYDGFKT